jgi:long-chain fatty acid transport protein
MNLCTVPAVTALGVSLLASTAIAGGFALREQSTTGLGQAFGGVAAGSAGVSSMFWNPATMTGIPGIQTDLDFALIAPSSKITPGAGSSPLFLNTTSGELLETVVLPSFYGSYQVNDQLWLGLSMNVPYGLTTKPNADWTGRLYGSTTHVSSLEVTPTVAYKINDWLSVGAGLQVEYFKARYTAAVPNPFAPSANPVDWYTAGPDGDSWGVGYTLGATVTPVAGTTIGLGFRSAVQQDIRGSFNGLPGPLALAVPTRPVRMNVMLPETATLGVSQKLGEQFTLNAGVEWTNWSRLKYPRVIDETTGQPYAAQPVLNLDYRDSWFFSVGGEYAIDPQWTVRAGVGYEISPVRTAVRTTRLPDNNRIWTTLGVSYKWNEKLTLDLAYAHLFSGDTPIRLVSGNPSASPLIPPMVANADNSVNIVSASLRYRWDDPAKPVPVAMPIVRKP